MKLTRRGQVAAGVIAVGFLWGSAFGIQAMNAIVIPGIVALLAGWWLVRRAPTAEFRREPIGDGFPGQPREVLVSVSAPPTLAVTVIDELPLGVRPVDEGIGPEGAADASDDWGSVVDRRTFRPVVEGRATYRVVAEGRGETELGPTRLRVTDPFGLVSETVGSDETVQMLTYPAVHELIGLRRQSDLIPDGAPRRDRHEFDRLREYDRGDALRDIHWKSSAKRGADPLIVKEFVSESDAGDVQIVAESDYGEADGMAEAAASIALQLLDEGVAVGLRTADQHVPVTAEGTQRTDILAALARTQGGRLDPDLRERASIVVQANGDEVQVRRGAGAVPFEQLREERRDVAPDVAAERRAA